MGGSEITPTNNPRESNANLYTEGGSSKKRTAEREEVGEKNVNEHGDGIAARVRCELLTVLRWVTCLR